MTNRTAGCGQKVAVVTGGGLGHRPRGGDAVRRGGRGASLVADIDAEHADAVAEEI